MMIADPARIDALALAVQEWNSNHARVDSRPLGQGDSLRTALRQVRVPLNAVYGDRDATAPDGPGSAEAILRDVRPDIDFRVVPGAGHWLPYEAAGTFNPMLRDMLQRSRSQAAESAA
jgi:pimeloyl-ACP methyl ester carboxylesterase